MEIATTCPACGSQMTVSTGDRNATCAFCGTNFEVDLSQTAPALKVIRPEEMTPKPLLVQSAESESILPLPAEPVYEPAARYEPPASLPPRSIVPPAANRRNVTWITIAIAVMAVVCGLCACMGLVLMVWNYSAR